MLARSSSAVSSITGNAAIERSERIVSSRVKPSISGMFTSEITASGTDSRRRSIALTPFSAWIVVWPSIFSRRAM